jgi:hypothetical protein
MVRGIEMITQICHQAGDGAGFGRNVDAACGSSGIFVEEHPRRLAEEVTIHGVEKVNAAGRLCRRKLAA